MKSVHMPRLLVAAAGSGCGKTTFVCAWLKLLKEWGKDPRSFKCGPDYIDPMFHERVLGIPSRNLDGYFSDEGQIRQSIAAAGGGCAVIEGVMGIYDGLSPAGIEASCYETACRSDTPVLLLVDAAGAGRTLISQIKGILADDPDRRIRALVLNRMSPAYYERFKPVLEEELARAGYAVCPAGCIPKSEALSVGSRHLGLLLPQDVADVEERIDAATELLREHCDTGALWQIMEEAAELVCEDVSPQAVPEDAPILAVARDEAFCFYYKDNLELFERLGVRIETFSPLRDESLPAGCCGILLGGGYPELHLAELSRNHAMTEALRTALAGGMPVLAECGGFMFLHEYIEDSEGTRFPMVGAVKGGCRWAGRLQHFGYLRIESCEEPIYRDLAGLKGHEFHYYASDAEGESCLSVKPDGSRPGRCMHAFGNGSLLGFPHFYYPSNPALLRAFLKGMLEYKAGI